MKRKIYSVFCMLLVCYVTKSNAQANQSLSNLISPTAVNQSLLPGVSNSNNLGSNNKRWKNLHLSSGIYFSGVLSIHAPGVANFFAGNYAGNTTLTGYYNAGSGQYALHYLTSGGNNTGTGYAAAYNTNTGYSNTAMGFYSLFYNASGYDNVAIGSKALFKNTIGHNHVAVGDSALYNQDINRYDLGGNTAVGSKSLFTNTSSYWNTGLGEQTLYSNTDGIANTALGHIALIANTTGEYNTSVGRLSMYSNTTGSYCTAIGAALYYNVTGNYNTALGYGADVYYLYGNLTNATAVGNSATVDASNKVRVGNTAVTSIGGQVSWTNFSDGRYKKNVKENVVGLAFINSLRPVTYTVDVEGLNNYYSKGKEIYNNNAAGKSSEAQRAEAEMKKAYDAAAKIVYDGFIAQEVEAAANKLGIEFSGVDKPQTKDGMYGLRYSDFVVPLVKAVQELSKMNDDKNAMLAAQQTQINHLQQQIDELKSIVIAGNQSSSSQQQINYNQSNALNQNIPNPFNRTTTISYTLPQQYTNAFLAITDKNGKTLKQISVSGNGKGTVTVDAATLASGAYNYSLVIDGKIAGTKQMELLK